MGGLVVKKVWRALSNLLARCEYANIPFHDSLFLSKQRAYEHTPLTMILLLLRISNSVVQAHSWRGEGTIVVFNSDGLSIV